MSIFEQWGVTPIINATGSVTRLGGAVMPPEVLAAFSEAAPDACSLEELQVAASRVLARHTGAAAGIVTAGCAAGLTLGAAAILAGLDAGRMERLPRPAAGDRQEFLVAREQRNGYDHAVRAAGATLVEVGFNEIVSNAGVRRTETWEYGAAITERTAGILYIAAADARPRLQEVVDLAHRHCLPVLVDAAGEVLPRNTLPDLVATGADLVACSGGKALRGPQSTGILCGRAELVGSALLQMLDMDDHPELWSPPAILPEPRRLFGQPRHGLGRGFKVSKEEIAALLTAVDLFFSGHYDRERPRQLGWLKQIAEQIPAPSRVELIDPPDGQRAPVLEVIVAEQALGKTAFEICRALRHGSPRVYVGHGQLAEGRLVIHPLCLTETTAAQVAGRLRAELTPAS
jgi:D-glucosaminate-6-phosphate ammonia-lyase